ncbi:hypothetical protein G6F57_004369 [Rhizopus arrhizus]|uniref:EKC/KEOPS complex subunit CGI121 n=1 Tax=Rhizopus oryzae TaxID=64495 RepID=A0A9P6X308_RHIOR|nr:hypothetical protein G6F23_002410 [Rhizopus arrhizus]KAG0768701.1 hypothetical protein G6F24_001701 [Rhizopus arrhizus]KAG0795516.1 hypothetical protein G6F21_002036 [Rhizopus arrhizus]KAG0813856.1 hypothetical protein G6F20_005233 [Rhizopus arrhizus]KAG0836396.1 hypothetical protein G6F18_005366 [Rhizopus arrhizus]
MESFALELFPNHGQVHMALFENVTNASELKHRLINQDTALTCALIDASFVIDRFHALLATNRAVHEEQSQKLKTYNLYSQIIFNFSPNTNIAKSFQQFGIKENTTSVVAIKVGDSADEAESFMKNCIKGNLVSLDQLSVIRDLKSIKNAYQIEEKEDVERVKSIVAGAIALKGH